MSDARAPALDRDGGPTARNTRNRIIDAAIDCFGKQGIQGTSIEQVADAVGVHRVTVHRAFPGGRDELVAEVLLERSVRVLDAALHEVDDSASITDLVVAAFTSFVMLARTDPLINEGLKSPAVQLALAPERAARLYGMTALWGQRFDPSAERDQVEFLDDPARVTDLLARTIVTLVREPGIVATEADVRAYLTDFIVPAITRPRSHLPSHET